MSKPTQRLAGPTHLSADSRKIFAECCDRPVITQGFETLLIVALECLDRLSEAQEILAREGVIIETPKSGCKHIHPAVRLEKDARTQFLAAWRQLGLGAPPKRDSRYAWKGS